jgi:hypothetical protein
MFGISIDIHFPNVAQMKRQQAQMGSFDFEIRKIKNYF